MALYCVIYYVLKWDCRQRRQGGSLEILLCFLQMVLDNIESVHFGDACSGAPLVLCFNLVSRSHARMRMKKMACSAIESPMTCLLLRRP